MDRLTIFTWDWVYRYPSDCHTRIFTFIQDHIDHNEIIIKLCELDPSVHQLQFSGRWTMGTHGFVMLYTSAKDGLEELGVMTVKISLPTAAELDRWEWDLESNPTRLDQFTAQHQGSSTYEALGLPTTRVYEPFQLEWSVPCLPMAFKYGCRLVNDFRGYVPSNDRERNDCAARQMLALSSLAHSMRALATFTSSTPGLAHIASIQEGLVMDEPFCPDGEDVAAANRTLYEWRLEDALEALTTAAAKDFALGPEMDFWIHQLFSRLPPENECFLTNMDSGTHNTLIGANSDLSYIDIITTCEPIGVLCQPPHWTGLRIHDTKETEYQFWRESRQDYFDLFQRLLCEPDLVGSGPCSDKELKTGKMIAESLRSVQAFFVRGTYIAEHLDNAAAQAWIAEVITELLPRVVTSPSDLEDLMKSYRAQHCTDTTLTCSTSYCDLA